VRFEGALGFRSSVLAGLSGMNHHDLLPITIPYTDEAD